MARGSWLAIPILLAAPFAVRPQDLRIQPDIAMAEAAYRDAEEAWIRNDPNLEKDLFKINPEDARRRIRHSAALRDEVMSKKQGYLDLLIQRTEQTRNRLAQSDTGMIPSASLKSDLEQQQTRILGEQERLDELIRDLPPGDEYLLVRRPLEDERQRLVNLQNNLAQRIRSLDSLDKAQQAIEGARRDPLAEKLDSVIAAWKEEKDATIRQRAKWATIYSSMEQAVSAPGNGRESSASNASAARKPAPAAAPAANVRPGGLTGQWTYRSEAGAWSGYAEPAMVTLELHEDGGVLSGSYTARLAVKSEAHVVHLTLTALRRTSNTATLHWKSATPAAEGEMELKLGGDGRLLVERSQSGDSYIPLGSEILLRK